MSSRNAVIVLLERRSRGSDDEDCLEREVDLLIARYASGGGAEQLCAMATILERGADLFGAGGSRARLWAASLTRRAERLVDRP